MKHFPLLIIIIFGSLGCKSNIVYNTTEPKTGDSIINCRIDKVKDTVVIQLSKLVEDCSIIKLSGQNEALLKNIWHVNISENYIGIRSKGNYKMPYKLFDTKGNYLNDIGAIGKGPYEYISLINSILDENSDRIFLTPFGEVHSVYAYNLSGEPLEVIPIPFTLRKPKIFLSNGKLVCFSMAFDGDKSVAHIQDIKGNLIQYIPPKKSWYSASYNEEIFSFRNTGYFDYYNTTIDTLQHYNFEDNRLQPVYTANYLNKRISSPHFSFELPTYYVTWVAKIGYVFVSKSDKKAFLGKIENDFYGGIPASLSFCNNGYFIDVHSAIDLKRHLSAIANSNDISKDMKLKMEALNRTIRESDNYYLFIGRFKK